jgi:hypothetical protein
VLLPDPLLLAVRTPSNPTAVLQLLIIMLLRPQHLLLAGLLIVLLLLSCIGILIMHELPQHSRKLTPSCRKVKPCNCCQRAPHVTQWVTHPRIIITSDHAVPRNNPSARPGA